MRCAGEASFVYCYFQMKGRVMIGEDVEGAVTGSGLLILKRSS